MFYTPNGGAPNGNHNDVNYDVVLRNCNGKLTQWSDTWQAEMQRGWLYHPSISMFYSQAVQLEERRSTFRSSASSGCTFASSSTVLVYNPPCLPCVYKNQTMQSMSLIPIAVRSCDAKSAGIVCMLHQCPRLAENHLHRLCFHEHASMSLVPPLPSSHSPISIQPSATAKIPSPSCQHIQRSFCSG